MLLLGIALGGAAGALARYGLSGVVYTWVGSRLPWGTLAVNLVGCLLLGLLMELSRHTTLVPLELRTVLGIGFLGAFTTFSTFGLETWRAAEAGDWTAALGNVALNVIGGLIAAAAGIFTARLLTMRTVL